MNNADRHLFQRWYETYNYLFGLNDYSLEDALGVLREKYKNLLLKKKKTFSDFNTIAKYEEIFAGIVDLQIASNVKINKNSKVEEILKYLEEELESLTNEN
jgi:hypothetical protein